MYPPNARSPSIHIHFSIRRVTSSLHGTRKRLPPRSPRGLIAGSGVGFDPSTGGDCAFSRRNPCNGRLFSSRKYTYSNAVDSENSLDPNRSAPKNKKLCGSTSSGSERRPRVGRQKWTRPGRPDLSPRAPRSGHRRLRHFGIHNRDLRRRLICLSTTRRTDATDGERKRHRRWHPETTFACMRCNTELGLKFLDHR